MKSVRIAGLAIGLVAMAAAAAVTAGCAGPGVQIMSTSHDDKNDPIQRGYDVGYDRGRSASARGAKPDNKMPGDQKDPETVSAYAQGYDDGYAGRKNRFGSVETRDWMHENEVPTVSDFDADESEE